jgi:hypothetical protein
LDHRTEFAHKCAKEGGQTRERDSKAKESGKESKQPSKPSKEKPCASPTCKTIIFKGIVTGVECTRCNREYCLKHRMEEDHDCKNINPIGGRSATTTLQQHTQSALSKIKLWAEGKRKEDEKRRAGPKKSGFLGFGKGGSGSGAATAQAELNALKRAAKGEGSVPTDKRIYLHVEASADTTKAKFPTGKFFYNKDWTVGRVLDMAAKALQVQNVNNHGGGEEEKLRVFHVEGGRLLKFSEKIGEPCVSGNMIVLLRGVGSGEPDLIDL